MTKVPVIVVALLPDAPPVILPVTPGALHAYVVPAGITPFMPFVGVTPKLTPLHDVAVIAVINADGFRFTVTEKEAPVHDPDTGVTIYVAVTTPIVVFVKVPVIEFTPDACDNPPVNPTPVGVVQVYVVPAGTIPFVPFTGLTVNNTPPHPVVLIGVITAVGLIVTVNVNVAFVPHKVLVGVIVYVAVCVVFVGFTNVPVIVDALLPDAPPVILPVTPGALHVYTVPAGTIPFVPFTGVILKKTPLHETPVIALITADGFTFTVKENTTPVQLPDNGVTRYVAVLVILVVLPNIPLIPFDGDTCVTPPVIPVPVGALQVKVVPAGIIPFVTFVGVILKNTPLHVVVLIAVICASGFKFTVTENDAPVHDPDTGVTIYVAVTTPIVVFVKVPVIELTPTPCEAPPVNPLPVGALQVYVVPAGTIPFVPFTGLTVNNTPPHPVVLIGVITAVGLIVTVNVNVAFVPHKVEVGVTVYVAVC